MLPPCLPQRWGPARLNLARTKEERNKLRLLMGRTQRLVCYPTEHKVNLRTLQPRHSAMHILRLDQTMNDQEVPMVQPPRRGLASPVDRLLLCQLVFRLMWSISCLYCFKLWVSLNKGEFLRRPLLDVPGFWRSWKKNGYKADAKRTRVFVGRSEV